MHIIDQTVLISRNHIYHINTVINRYTSAFLYLQAQGFPVGLQRNMHGYALKSFAVIEEVQCYNAI